MIKILQVNTCNNSGGANRVASSLHEGLNKETGFASYYAHGRGETIKEGRNFKFSSSPEIYAHAILTRITGLEGYGTYFSTKKLLKYMMSNEFDIIHLHNIHGYYINISLFIKYLKIANKPILWTFHDCWPFTGSCAYPFNCSKYVNGCGGCAYRERYPKSFIDRSSYMFNLKKNLFIEGWNPIIITPSEWLSNVVKNTYFKKYEVKTIPNGIDIDIFKPLKRELAKKKIGVSPKSKVIIFVAADLQNELKGAAYFFKAINELNDVKDLTVITVGKKYSGNINLRVKFKQFGFISDQNMLATLYSAADVFCISSIDEAFGLTVTEAMACGVPVVGFEVGGIKEQVTLECGFLVPPKNHYAFAAAISELLNNEEKRLLFGCKCRERVIKFYSVNALIDSYKKLYSSLKNNSF